VNFLKRRDAIVPFEKCRGVPGALDGPVVEFPDGVDHRMVVCVQNVFLEFRMAGDMNLCHPKR